MKKRFGTVQVTFLEHDNFKLEKVMRLVVKKLLKVGISSNSLKDVQLEPIVDSLLDDDFDLIKDIMLEPLDVEGAGILDNPANVAKAMKKWGIAIIYFLIFESVKHYLGEQLITVIESDYIPAKLRAVLKESLTAMKAQLSGAVSEADILTTETQEPVNL